MIFSIFLTTKAISQSLYQQFAHLHKPEKVWILLHFHVALKTQKITKLANKIAAEAIQDTDLDGDYNGGQVDAFRHTLWMAMLAQKINPKAVKKLGEAHEKGNKIDFDKKNLEENKLPDSVSCQMDLKNNNVGIEIGKNNKKTSIDDLKNIVKQAVIRGDCFIIKKDKNRNYLDENGKIIPENEWAGLWLNPKIIVTSNNKY